MLTHRNWKFEKFVSQKIETMQLDNIATPSADNVLMEINSTVAWQVCVVPVSAIARLPRVGSPRVFAARSTRGEPGAN